MQNFFMRLLSIRWLLLAFAIVYLNGLVNGIYNAQLSHISHLWVADILGSFVLPLMALMYVIKHVDSMMKIDSSVTYSYKSMLMICGLAIFLLSLASMLALVWCFQHGVWQNMDSVYAAMLDGEHLFIKATYMALTAAVFEELFYRSFLFIIVNNLFQQHIHLIFVVLSSVLFASIHWEGGIQSVVSAFSFGMAAALFYIATGHLLPLMVAHFCYDMIAFAYPEIWLGMFNWML